MPERVDNILSRPSPAASSVLDLIKYDMHHWLTIFSTSEQKKYQPGCDRIALYDIIVEAGKGAEFEFLTERPVNLSLEPLRSTNCLLVATTIKESQPNKSSIRNIYFVRQGQISYHDQVICIFLNSLLEQAQTLQRDNITQEI